MQYFPIISHGALISVTVWTGGVRCYISKSSMCCSANPVILVLFVQKSLPCYKKTCDVSLMQKSASRKLLILYMLCFENINEDNVEDWQQSDACEPGFQYMTGRDGVSDAAK
jgi:hypothetical protein